MGALSGAVADPGQYNTDTKKRLRRASRTSDTGSIVGTEIGVLRLDGIPFKAGRSYQIHTSTLLLISSVTGDLLGVRFRYSTTGTAEVTSTEFQFTDRRVPTGTISEGGTVLSRSYNPSADETVSLLLTLQRISGSGNTQILGSSAYPIEILIDDMGDDPGATGVSI